GRESRPGMAQAIVRNRGFLACVGLLAVLCAGYQQWMERSDIVLKKEAVPLKARLDELNKNKLLPYKLLHVQTLKPEMVDTLGTTEYVSWILQDTRLAGSDRPEQIVNLFVSYYTGKPDQV